MNVKYKNSGLVTVTRKEIARFKEQAKQEAMLEILRQQQAIINAVQDGSLYLVLLTGYKALADLECDYDFAMEFGNRVADLLTELNEGKLQEADLEQEIKDVYGIELKRVE